MASADLRRELECSICLHTYSDPVNQRCGHNFCRVCIDRALNTQKESGDYFCPQCRKRFRSRPILQRNITLRNIVDTLCPAQPDQEEIRIRCSQCILFPVPAVKSCLHCETSLCNDHLKVHSNSSEHVLVDPTTFMEERKCSIHRELLKYYCTTDAACICVSCRLDGEHQGHKVETLDEASEKKKKELKNVLQKLITEREETERRLQSLKECKEKVQEAAAGVTKKVNALFIELRRKLEDLEKTIMRETSSWEEQFSRSLANWIQQLEIKKDKLSRKMGHIEDMFNISDPLTVLQEADTVNSDTEDGGKKDTERRDKLLLDGRYLDVVAISHTLHTGLSDMIKEVNVCFNIQEAADILLDVNTAHNRLQISDDLKTASWSAIRQNHPEAPERFQKYAQVLSSQRFSSGRHYWDVDVSKSEDCKVGMCYPSIERGGMQSGIGRNKTSWGFWRNNRVCFLMHDNKAISVYPNISSNRIRIYVNYEAGQLSFYDLCHPIRHLHTFTTTFTEPLHAALLVRKGNIKICGKM